MNVKKYTLLCFMASKWTQQALKYFSMQWFSKNVSYFILRPHCELNWYRNTAMIFQKYILLFFQASKWPQLAKKYFSMQWNSDNISLCQNTLSMQWFSENIFYCGHPLLRDPGISAAHIEKGSDENERILGSHCWFELIDEDENDDADFELMLLKWTHWWGWEWQWGFHRFICHKCQIPNTPSRIPNIPSQIPKTTS